MSAENHAELVARYGELTRGLQRLLDALRPEARSPKPELQGSGERLTFEAAAASMVPD